MQDSVFYLACPTLVPILRSDISAGSSCHVHTRLVAVVTVGAFPEELAAILHNEDLSVKATLLAIVALGVQLGIHNMIVDVTHYVKNGLNVVLHIGNLNVGDRASGGECLELCLK